MGYDQAGRVFLSGSGRSFGHPVNTWLHQFGAWVADVGLACWLKLGGMVMSGGVVGQCRGSTGCMGALDGGVPKLRVDFKKQ